VSETHYFSIQRIKFKIRKGKYEDGKMENDAKLMKDKQEESEQTRHRTGPIRGHDG